MSDRIRVGIVGGTGYTGVELLRLLSAHPAVELVTITSRKEAGTRVDAMFPSLRGRVDLRFVEPDQAPLAGCDVVFFATPHGVAMSQARALLAAGVRVIDLAADFRLQDAAAFERWYKMPHACPELLREAVYGLPEIYRARLPSARIVANPGCYPTTVQLGLLPLLEGGRRLINTRSLIADAKSGVSGAGRKEELAYLFCEAADNHKAYGLRGHRHHPEMLQQLRAIAGHDDLELVFVPHLVPMIRGMLTTLHLQILPEARDVDFQRLYEERFAAEPFVDVLPTGSEPDTRSVRGSNMVRMAVHRVAADRLVVLVVLDNLVKGASGQAVQCMNAMFGRPETEGLAQAPLLP
ncbi:MAG: N-acetyl-gamma-glutamyl-phosphate reductase [Sutterellaceae bacterium]|nr:N-acetyl-gamma-glutamyl-phosphate reductase [Burkholderiaceae bacterium]MDW8430773.1 N-acetyl-gamma-glutamyl-phosphate reductase [Sutterellaceae bacterium]